jgi:hypothetical protein
MFEYFYNEILRKTIISFGTLFNGLTIKQDGSTVKVPLAYGPTQKFLARLEQAPNLSQATQISLPRMSFEFTGMTYDSSRKVTTTQTIAVKNPDDGTDIKKVFMPVPYNMQFELAIMCKLNDDALQLVEQILPFFQPQYNLTINLVSLINEKKDVPVVLENITMDDQYEGDFTSRRVLLYTLRFTATINVADGTAITVNKFIDVEGEEMKVTKITGNKLTVKRGQDSTISKSHVRGTGIKGIDYSPREDSNLIELGDDFGFDGSYS